LAEAIVLENRLTIQITGVRKDRNVAYLPSGILIVAMFTAVFKIDGACKLRRVEKIAVLKTLPDLSFSNSTMPPSQSLA